MTALTKLKLFPTHIALVQGALESAQTQLQYSKGYYSAMN
jgi:hypothetical protein